MPKYLNITLEQQAEIAMQMRQAREKDRGYASFFGWAIDRDLEELGVAKALAESLEFDGALFFDALKIRGRGEDPPDVEGVDKEGERIALEITELVDGNAIKAFKAGRHYDYAEWSQGMFLDSLKSRLISKAKRHSKLKGGPYEGGYVVVVYTDEPALPAETVSAYLEGAKFSLEGVSKAFLLLSYDPRQERCPYFELMLSA